MPDPGSGFSRLCAACGRRVPKSVAVCRCGAEVPQTVDDQPAGSVSPGHGLSAVNLAIGALLLGAIAATGYWASRPASPEPSAAAPGAETTEGGVLPPPSGLTISAERRAWDAELARAGASPPMPTTPAAVPLATA